MTNLNIRVDEQLKADAQTLYKSLGMDLSTAVNVFLRQSVQMQGLPFQPRLDPFYSESNLRALRESIKELEEGKVVVKTMEELEKMVDG